MALVREAVDKEADAIKKMCEDARELLMKIKDLLSHNSDLSIDWAAVSLPDYIEEDADGNLVDRTFARADVANAIGSLDNIRKAFEGEEVARGDHLGNLNKIAAPSGMR